MPNLSLRIDDETLIRIDEARGAESRTDFLKEAVDLLLDHRFWKIEKIKEGIRDIEEGRILTQEEVKQSIRDLGLNVD